MEKKKIVLKTLELKSFVTGMGAQSKTVKGGDPISYDSDCCPSIDCPRTNFTCYTNNCEVTLYYTDCC